MKVKVNDVFYSYDGVVLYQVIKVYESRTNYRKSDSDAGRSFRDFAVYM